jgi:hypothetical protein
LEKLFKNTFCSRLFSKQFSYVGNVWANIWSAPLCQLMILSDFFHFKVKYKCAFWISLATLNYWNLTQFLNFWNRNFDYYKFNFAQSIKIDLIKIKIAADWIDVTTIQRNILATLYRTCHGTDLAGLHRNWHFRLKEDYAW